MATLPMDSVHFISTASVPIVSIQDVAIPLASDNIHGSTYAIPSNLRLVTASENDIASIPTDAETGGKFFW